MRICLLSFRGMQVFTGSLSVARRGSRKRNLRHILRFSTSPHNKWPLPIAFKIDVDFSGKYYYLKFKNHYKYARKHRFLKLFAAVLGEETIFMAIREWEAATCIRFFEAYSDERDLHQIYFIQHLSR